MPMAVGEEKEDGERGIFGRSMLKERGPPGMGFMELFFFRGNSCFTNANIVFVSVQHY